MKEFLCPMCFALEYPNELKRWRILAEMVLESKNAVEHPNYQWHLLATYLQGAYEKGFNRGKVGGAQTGKEKS